ncbi:MAG: hypothetical protein CMD34_05120 [Flavobacteriales bacterium]|nr:hypothetical protein [Flavobacteriales bacterium]|tara:strand:+ start:4329 stop:5354 length:1026 start_codon:yes stop_codon:yes gene_type:complete
MKRIFILFCIFLPFFSFSQIGGLNSYSFVNLEISPRVTAMGGAFFAVYDNDLSIGVTNPSVLNIKMNNEIMFNYTDYISDINCLSFAYARDINNFGTAIISVKSFNYGDLVLNNSIGDSLGMFSASDQIITLGFGKLLYEKLMLGLSLNLLNSNYYIYSSLAISSNIGVTYLNLKKNFISSLLVKNLGRQLTTYNVNESLPFEIQFALSKKLAHLPFRYHITYTNLSRFDIKSPFKLKSQTNFETGNLEVKQETFAKTFLRHIVIGGELNPFNKSFFIRGGFNFQRRFDLSLSSYPATTGFSWGLGFKVSKFRFDYSRSSFHISSYPNYFSISTNLSTFGL